MIQDVNEAGRPEEVGLCGRIRCQHQDGTIACMDAPGPRENRSPPHALATWNWEKNLTMVGAVRLSGPVLLRTRFASANGTRFVQWIRTLLRKLHPGNIVVMDDAKALHDTRVHQILKGHYVGLVYQPPYSPAFNPIEPAWANTKREIRFFARRLPESLRKVAAQAFWRITFKLCFCWFQHDGYKVQSN